ncbi:Short-chain dehydrogenase/reductase SDR protein [Dioscorea alata]|uniref:Short-chain dehydrogenase/reductase SDR protein n=1 Tax=Dioscorea alata TaxID=55571 RepID=A0ACB7US22_DIOAL|nr:Short-chain dehydrogenase/reductase SDR protein [Dioscorea alata]
MATFSSSSSSLAAKRLEGKVALITGGSRGIGECTARLFAQHGAKVIIADIEDQLGASVCNDIGHDTACFIHCDVTVEDDIKNAVDLAVSKYGKLDIMFNNAGLINKARPLVDSEKSEFEKVMSVIVTGSYLGTKHAARVMIPAKSGSIIATASVASVIGGSGTHAYTAAKHALVGLTKSAAVELGQFGVRVNCVSPYAVATKLLSGFTEFDQLDDDGFEKLMSLHANLKGHVLKAEDVAHAVLYLASDEAKYVSGHNLLVDGGFTIVNPSLLALDPAALPK